MNFFGIFLGNVGIAAFMIAFALAWDLFATVSKRRRVGEALHSYRPSGPEWSAYYWRRVRSYLVSYALIIGLLVFLPLLFGQKAAFYFQLINLVRLLPGLAGYFILAGLVPARFVIYPEGFGCHALIPFLPGRPERGADRLPSGFRVGIRFWHQYRDAVPRGNVLVLRGDSMGAELVIPKGGRDRLLGLAREGLKRAREERRRERRLGKNGGERASSGNG